MLNGDFFADGVRIESDFGTSDLSISLHFVIEVGGSACSTLLDLFVAANKADFAIGFREIDQVQVFLHFVGFVGLSLSLHVDEGNVLILVELPCLQLTSILKHDFVFAVDEFRRVHLVIELIRVAKLSLQSKFFCTTDLEC